MNIYVGTSGYSYAHWGEGVFYPAGLAKKQWLEFYCRHFSSVELNVTFYRLPQASTFQEWYKRTPQDFTFVVKGSRFITHIKRLKDVREALMKLGDNISLLKSKIRCLLWQLPPGFKKDRQRLSEFCRQLKKIRATSHLHHVFEFREESWFHPDIYSVLKEYQFCLCFADSPEKIGEEVLTCDIIYLRFHGGSLLYGSNYSKKELRHWVKKVESFNSRIGTFYAFFNNDAGGYAVANALSFRQLFLDKYVVQEVKK
jgi:uncharacterized protein YecE (DUF72 family)